MTEYWLHGESIPQKGSIILHIPSPFTLQTDNTAFKIFRLRNCGTSQPEFHVSFKGQHVCIGKLAVKADLFIPLVCAECDNSLPLSGASSIPLCYVLFPATLLHQLFFHPLSPHLAICFLVDLSILLFPNSYTIPFWEFYFLPFSVHAQTNVI